MKSWKTTLFGAGGLLTVWASAASAILDGDPSTNPNWELVIAVSMPAIACLFARDNNVSSEQAGVK